MAPLVREEVILLVEDNPDDQFMTRRALKQNNLCNQVVVVHDGEQALDYLFGTCSARARTKVGTPPSCPR